MKSGLDGHEPLLAREDEKDRLASLLQHVLTDDEGPDQGYLVLVHGPAGIGKTTLLEQYRRMLSEQPESDHALSGRFLVAAINWEAERFRNSREYPSSGSPLSHALDMIYTALTEAIADNNEARHCADRAFREYRRQAAAPPGSALPAMAASAVSATASPAQAEAVISPPDVLARSFADGLRDLSRSALPLVLSMDAAEVLGDGLVPLFDVIRGSGRRVVWLVGMRLDSDQLAPAGSVSDVYLRQLRSARLRLISPSRLTTGDVDEYLRSRLGAVRPAGVTAAAVTRLTLGIPLAVKLAVNLLQRGMPSPQALRQVAAWTQAPEETAGPDLSRVASGLALRYLTHVADEGTSRDPDLDLIFGLALRESIADDPELLGALWQVDPQEVAATKSRLIERHDLVLGGEPLLHQVVRDAIRLFMLNPDQRVRVRAANERAQQVLRERLAGLSAATVEAQLDSDTWCSAAGALLWHTLWLDNQEGLGLLAHLLPAALLLRPAFGRQLLTIAEHFSPASPPEFRLVAELRVLAPASAFPDRAFSANAEHAGEAFMGVSRPQAAIELLRRGLSYADPVLAPDVTGPVLLSIMEARYPGSFGRDTTARLALLTRIDAGLARDNGDPGTISRIVAACAQEIAQSLSDSPETLTAGLQAAELATRRDPARAHSWRIAGDSQRYLEHFPEALAAYGQAIKLDPYYAATHFNRGLVLGRLGRDAEALAAYDRAVELDPAVAASHFERGLVLGRLGRDAEALAAYDRAVELDPQVAASHFERGFALSRLGRDDEALAAYDQAVRLDPEHAASHFERGLVLGRVGRDAEALAAYDRAVELDPQVAASHFERGLVLGRLGRDAEALAAYDRAVELDPQVAASHFERGFALGRLGRGTEALAAYDRAVELDPAVAASHFERGLVLGRLGRDAEALAAYDRAVELDPQVAASHFERGFALGRLGRDAEALAAYDEAVRLVPDDAASHGNRAFVLGRLGRDAEALAAYDQAVRLDPDYAASHYERGVMLARLGRDEEALAAYDRVVRLDPDHAGGHGNHGVILERLGRPQEALAAYDQAVRLAPDDAVSHGNRAFVLGQLGRHEEALAAYDRAVRLDPDNAACHGNRGVALGRLGRRKEALAAYHTALRLDPDDVAARGNRGEVLMFMGRSSKAAVDLRAAIRLKDASALEARVLLAVLIRGTDRAEAAQLCQAALREDGLEWPAFRRGELRALAWLILGDADQAEAELRVAAVQHKPGDIIQEPLYAMLAHPPVPGLERLTVAWQEIMSAQAGAVASS